MFVLPNPPYQIVGDTDVKRAVSLVGHDADRILHKINLDSRPRFKPGAGFAE